MKQRNSLAAFLLSFAFGGFFSIAASASPIQTATPAAAASAAETSIRTAYSAYSNGGSAARSQSRIVLDLEKRRVSLYRSDMLVGSYPVAVGTAATPTPRGEFTVSNMVVNPVWQSPWTGEVHPPGPDSALGLRWIGFADSPEGAFGFHGTPTLESIGEAASNGCVRMRNEDVVALFAQVELGTTVLIQ